MTSTSSDHRTRRSSSIDSSDFGQPTADYYSVVRAEPTEEGLARARARLEPLEKKDLIQLVIEITSRNVQIEDRAQIAELEWVRAEAEVRSLRKQLDSLDQMQEKVDERENVKKQAALPRKPKQSPALLVANEVFERFNIDSDAQTKFYESRKLNFSLRQTVLERFVTKAQSEVIMAAIQNKPFKGSQVFVQCLRSVENKPRKPSDNAD